MTTTSQSVEDTFNISSGSIFYKKWRPQSCASSVPVVLMHESLGCVEMWRDYPRQLADRLGRTIITYDRFGFGRSSQVTKLPRADFVKREATDIFPIFRERLGLDEFIIYGHSIGGAMAVEIAAEFQESCIAVITESALPFSDENSLAGVAAAKKAYEDDKLVEKLRKFHGDKVTWVMSAWMEAWFLPEFADWNMFEALRKNKRPLLAIHGENDKFGSVKFPETICRLSGGATEMLVIPNCGHAPHRDATLAVLDGIDGFLQSINN